MPEEKPPWLFIYFRDHFKHPIKVIEALNGNELWLCAIGTGDGIVHKFSKSLIDLWDRHFISLPPGFWWSGLLFREKGVDQTFSPAGSKNIIFSIPEKYITRVYDMANRAYLYQWLPPNPPR